MTQQQLALNWKSRMCRFLFGLVSWALLHAVKSFSPNPVRLQYTLLRKTFQGWKRQVQPYQFPSPSSLDLGAASAGQRAETLAMKHSQKDESSLPFTSALLRISYDGTRFTGWSGANDPKNNGTSNNNLESYRRKRPRRRRGSRFEHPLRGNVRSVEGVLRNHLAKIYGNLDPSQVIVEGSSRTDKGVHARSMMAMIYALNQTATEEAISLSLSSASNESMGRNIPGKRTPHPANNTDSTVFLPLPMNMSKMAFALNRMLPPDVRIMGIAPLPEIQNNNDSESKDPSDAVFHPTLSAVTKTYVYTFSVSTLRPNIPEHQKHHAITTIPDPTTRRWVWHIPAKTNNTTNCAFDMDTVNKACQLLQGTHNFSSFQGAARGMTDKQKRLNAPLDGTLCTLKSVSVQQVPSTKYLHFPAAACQYTLTITGDRFLYKMARFLAGAVVVVGTGELELNELQAELNGNGADKRSFPCAPAAGLILYDVDYNTTINWQPLRN